MPRRGLIIFWIFLLFFSEFSCPGRVWTEFGSKTLFVFNFSAYLVPFRLKIMPGRGLIIFWIFFLYFSEFSFPGRVWTEYRTKIVFSLGLSHPFWLKILLEKGFLIFGIFLLFFSEFSCPGRVWTEFFAIFFGILLPVSSSNGIWD